ncbi:MAG: amidohydrolase family protein [Armatimonadota bacterium]|jgi:imidazolonepropionase-like amidohydrolase
MTATAITNARLIDGTAAEPLEDATLIIRDECIEAVGPSGEVAVPDDARIIDADGMTLLPGLIDAHMHVGTGYGPIRRLQDCLLRGTTTVADVTGGPSAVKLREAIEAGIVRGCARYHVGCVVGCTFGHLRRDDEHVAGVEADGPWEVRRGVRQMVEAGADFIKTAASGGFQWADESVAHRNYTQEELDALADEAHAWHRKVSVHAHTQPGIGMAIRAGIDMIHHGSYIDDEGLRDLREAGLHFVPTLYITSERSYSNEGRPPHMAERMRDAHGPHREGVARAIEMGVPIAVGTDGGPGSAQFELQELVACGMSPMQAIEAGTRVAAEALGIEGLTGTLEPGKRADLQIVRGDPLSDIALLEDADRIALVLRDGKAPLVEMEIG